MAGGMSLVAAAEVRRRRRRGARRSRRRPRRPGRRRGGRARRPRGDLGAEPGGVASSPIVTGRPWAAERDGCELGQAEACPLLVTGARPRRRVPRRASGGGGDGDRRVGEDPAGLGLTARAGEGEEHPVGVAGRCGQPGVAVELAGEAIEAFGAVVVLEEEREAGAVVGPDAVAVGADDLAPLAGAAPLGPPLLEARSRAGCGRSGAGR